MRLLKEPATAGRSPDRLRISGGLCIGVPFEQSGEFLNDTGTGLPELGSREGSG